MLQRYVGEFIFAPHFVRRRIALCAASGEPANWERTESRAGTAASFTRIGYACPHLPSLFVAHHDFDVAEVFSEPVRHPQFARWAVSKRWGRTSVAHRATPHH